jgi:putative oxidoreductase
MEFGSMSLDRVGKFWPETLSVLRFLIGLLFVEHGTAKLFSFPHWTMEQPEVGSLLWFQGVLEMVGGVLFAVGFMTRPVAFILAGDMAVAYFVRHAPRNFFPMLNGGDAAILYCFVFLIYFVAGPGRWAADGSLK